MISKQLIADEDRRVCIIDTTMSRFSLAQNRKFQSFRDEDNVAFKPFVFAQLADTQLGFFNDDKEWQQEIDLIHRAVGHLNAMKPAFVIVCGDLTNSLVEIYPHQSPEIRTRQVADFKKAFTELHTDIPLVCVCGNHDVGNTPNKTTLQRWTNDFGDDYFAFRCNGVASVILNSSLIADPSSMREAFEEHLSWFEKQLSRASTDNVKHILVFAHHPFFLLRGDEPDLGDEFGITEYVDVGTGRLERLPNAYFHVPLERRTRVLRLMQQYGARHIFSGHFHRNALAHCDKYAVTQIITSAVGRQLGKDKSGFRLVTVGELVSYPYFSFEELDQQSAIRSLPK